MKLLAAAIAAAALMSAQAEDHPHWSYQRAHGAAHWGNMEAGFAECKLGKENAALKSVFEAMPANVGETRALDAGFDPAAILPADRAYYKFVGSLTPPPCSEGVRWQVLKQPVELSRVQVAAFRKLYKMNARPVQPLNGRTVEGS